MKFSEHYTFRTLVDSDCLYHHASPVLHQFGISKYQPFILADRLLPVFLHNHSISLRLSLVIYLSIGCNLCLALELLFEHVLLVLIEIQLIDAFYPSFVELLVSLETFLDLSL